MQQTAKLRPEECSVKVMGKRGREWEEEGKRAGSTVDREQRQERGEERGGKETVRCRTTK